MVETAEEITIFLLAVYLAFRSRVVELQFLHGVFHGGNLLVEQGFEIRTLVTFGFSLNNTLFDPGIFYKDFSASLGTIMDSKTYLIIVSISS